MRRGGAWPVWAESGKQRRAVIKKLNTLLCVISLSGAIFFLGVIPAAEAQNIQGKWGLGFRGGASFLTQDPLVGVEGDAGPIVSGNIVYGLTKVVALGFNVEWETHGTELLGVDFGRTTTVSLLPFVEFRGINGQFVPYGVLGAGININSFDESDEFVTGCIIVFGAPCDVEPENTFALKVGAGADYFVTPTLVVNTELGWKLNSGDADSEIGGITVGTDDFDVSAFSLLFGVRAYF